MYHGSYFLLRITLLPKVCVFACVKSRSVQMPALFANIKPSIVRFYTYIIPVHIHHFQVHSDEYTGNRTNVCVHYFRCVSRL